MDEFEKIKERLKKEGIEVVSITPEGGEYKAEIRFCTPAGELIEDEILFVGTDADFVRGFEFYAANYDVDEHVAARMSHRGSNGVPATARALVEDAEGVSRMLRIAAKNIRFDDLHQAEPDVYKMLAVSNRHLRPETYLAMLFGKVCGEYCFRKPVPDNDAASFGVFVCVGDIDLTERNKLPADLAQLVDYCHCHDIWWLLIDEGYSRCELFTDFDPEWKRANTKFSFLYRDADNYKTHNVFVLRGLYKTEEIREIKACCDGDNFIAEQVGLWHDLPGDGTVTEADHCWSEIYSDDDALGFEVSYEPPTVDMSFQDLLENFRKAKYHWDEAKYAPEI